MTDQDSTNGPAPSPELPLTVHVDGNLGAVDFVKRLHRAGLELVNSDDGAYSVLRLAQLQDTDPEQGEHESLRVRLWQAAGIAHAVRHALWSDSEADHIQLQSALEIVEKIVDDVASALEGTEHE